MKLHRVFFVFFFAGQLLALSQSGSSNESPEHNEASKAKVGGPLSARTHLLVCFDFFQHRFRKPRGGLRAMVGGCHSRCCDWSVFGGALESCEEARRCIETCRLDKVGILYLARNATIPIWIAAVAGLCLAVFWSSRAKLAGRPRCTAPAGLMHSIRYERTPCLGFNQHGLYLTKNVAYAARISIIEHTGNFRTRSGGDQRVIILTVVATSVYIALKIPATKVVPRAAAGSSSYHTFRADEGKFRFNVLMNKAVISKSVS